MNEAAVLIDCHGDSMLGIVSMPTRPSSKGVVIVVGGPQYRVGSHRQFVITARHLASAGFPTLRFDSRGMGDSTGTFRSFEDMDADIGAAIDALIKHAPSVESVTLFGLCDGASAALLYLQKRDDPRVSGLCLANPWVRSELSLARTQVKHYYLQRLLNRDFWKKLLSGGVAASALLDLIGAVRRSLSPSTESAGTSSGSDTRPFQSRMAAIWQRFKQPVLLVLSGDDYTAKEFLVHAEHNGDWQGALNRPNVVRLDLPLADHTFSSGSDLQAFNAGFSDWIAALPGSAPDNAS